jgi:hypothetical protein
MNRTIQNASSVTARCRRFIAFLTSSLRETVSTAQIHRYQQPVDNLVQKLLSRSGHAEHLWKLDCHDMLFCKSPSRAHRKRLKRAACGVAIALVGALCLASEASTGSIDAIDPKRYVRLALDKREALCLSRLIGKESAWNHKAIGNLNSPSKSYVYGLLQLKNPIVKDKTPIEQIHFGLKYIDHRYQGDTCKAWEHWKVKGWH